MAGGRGAPGRGRDEPPESYPQRQDHELQALEAIYGADFQDLRPDACGRVGTWLIGSRWRAAAQPPLARFSLARPTWPGPSRAADPAWDSGVLTSFTIPPTLTFCPCTRRRSAGLHNPRLGRILLQPFSQVGSSLLPGPAGSH